MSRYGGCTFQDKVRNAMNANFSAAIVYNLESDKVKVPKTIFFGHDDVDSNFIQVIPMGGQDDALIPSVFIGFQSGRELLAHYNYYVNPHVWVVITDDDPFDINTYLLPFAIVVGVCFVIMLGIVIFKCLQDYR
jgi:E3 ubiquitin-protein ligase RNF13